MTFTNRTLNSKEGSAIRNEPTALDRIKRTASRISREERRSSALQMFEGLGLDEDDVAHMAESVGLEADDLLLMSTTSVVQEGRHVVDGETMAQGNEIFRLLSDVHQAVCGEVVVPLHRLNVTERELYEAASTTPRRAVQLCLLAGHDLSSHTKQCLAVLVKLGLLTKVRGQGYVRESQG